ncbi:MAG TPA: hypothetical protein VJ761_11480 [Ktedonobacteraceae bacterium]|nr:hypothetical protein [Ktedonobacteraceae bacterium]
MAERDLDKRASSIVGIAFCAIAFVICILLTVAPLSRIPDPVIHLQTPAGTYLARVGAWLPDDLGLTANHLASQVNTNYLEFLILIALAFAIYGLCYLFIRHQAPAHKHRQTLWLIWIGTIAAGLIYVFTPAMLSHDILVYASYSRVLVVYHANPYFVPLSAYPHDPFYPMNYWSYAIAAYGPVWLGICAFWGLLAGSQPLGYALAFRLLALAAHLINIWLVTTTLRTMEQSSRTVALGALLYAWNPLVLLESSLGGHNDVFMVTFILAGILLAVRADRQGLLTTPRGYLPSIIAFTLATLIKFTTLPLIVLFILLLACRVLHPANSTLQSIRETFAHRWKPTLLTILFAGLASALVALAFYGPFWIGHSVQAIVSSFTSPPSALYAENSILRAILAWQQTNSLPAHTIGNTLLSILANHNLWNDISILALAITILIGVIWMWQAPTIRNFALISVAALGALLIVTPWFYSWYVTWLIGLIAICLPLKDNRAGRALLAFALTFSASAFLTYLFKDGYPPFGIWTGFLFLTTIAPPILVSLIVYFCWKPSLQVPYPAKSNAVQEKVRA